MIKEIRDINVWMNSKITQWNELNEKKNVMQDFGFFYCLQR
jgi:hypothetical protein